MKDNITFTFDYEKDKTDKTNQTNQTTTQTIEQPKLNLWLLGLILLGIIAIKK